MDDKDLQKAKHDFEVALMIPTKAMDRANDYTLSTKRQFVLDDIREGLDKGWQEYYQFPDKLIALADLGDAMAQPYVIKGFALGKYGITKSRKELVLRAFTKPRIWELSTILNHLEVLVRLTKDENEKLSLNELIDYLNEELNKRNQTK